VPTIAIVVCSCVSGASLIHKQLARLQHPPRAPTGLMSGGWTIPSHVAGVAPRRDVGWCRAPRPMRFPGTVPSTLDVTRSLCSPLEGGVVLRDGLESVASNYFFIGFRATAAIGRQRALSRLARRSLLRRRHAHLLTDNTLGRRLLAHVPPCRHSSAVRVASHSLPQRTHITALIHARAARTHMHGEFNATHALTLTLTRTPPAPAPSRA
jgi:hypothetical protein